MHRRAILVGLAAFALVMMSAAPGFSQCCGTACIDADDDGSADDAVRCHEILSEGVEDLAAGHPVLAGCQDIDVACAGGRINTFPPVGCVCVGSTCEGGTSPLTSEACTARAATGCNDAGAAEVTIDSPACG